MIERAPLSDRLGCQGIELFRRRETFCPFLDHHLALLEHGHELDAHQRALGRFKGFEPEHGTCHPLDGSMVRLCRKVALLGQKPTTGFRKINNLRPTTFLFSVVCDIYGPGPYIQEQVCKEQVCST
jgi:hypothetical protein